MHWIKRGQLTTFLSADFETRLWFPERGNTVLFSMHHCDAGSEYCWRE